MSARSKARHVQKVARERGLEDSYQKIYQLVLHHWQEIHNAHEANPELTQGEAAEAVVLPKLDKKSQD